MMSPNRSSVSPPCIPSRMAKASTSVGRSCRRYNRFSFRICGSPVRRIDTSALPSSSAWNIARALRSSSRLPTPSAARPSTESETLASLLGTLLGVRQELLEAHVGERVPDELADHAHRERRDVGADERSLHDVHGAPDARRKYFGLELVVLVDAHD